MPLTMSSSLGGLDQIRQYSLGGGGFTPAQLVGMNTTAFRGASLYNQMMHHFINRQQVGQTNIAVTSYKDRIVEHIREKYPSVTVEMIEDWRKLSPLFGLLRPVQAQSSPVPAETETAVEFISYVFGKQPEDVWLHSTFENYVIYPGLTEPALTLPDWTPSVVCLMPWRPVFSSLETSLSQEPQFEQMSKRLRTELRHWGPHFTYTNGGWVGTLARMEKCSYIAQKYRDLIPGHVRVTKVGITGKTFPQRLELVLHCTQLDPEVTEELFEIQKLLTTGAHLMKVEKDSDAGPSWYYVSQKKVHRHQVLGSDIVTNLLIEKYIDEQDANEDFKREDMVSYLLSNGVQMLKPKAEVIESHKLTTKVRSIWVGDSCNQMLLGAACRLFTPRMHTVRASTSYAPTYGNLYAWTGFFGGMQHLLDFVFEQTAAKRWAVFFYSDNCYFVTPEGAFVSCDVSKMEATSTVEEATSCMDYLLRVIGIRRKSRPALHDCLSVQGSELCHDVVCFRQNLAFRVPGLSSGSQNTFLINHMRMAATVPEMLKDVMARPQETLYSALKRLVDPSQSPDVQFSPDAVIPFNLEVTACDCYIDPLSGEPLREPTTTSSITAMQPPAPIEAKPFLPRYVSLYEAQQRENAGTTEAFGPIVRLDLLGYDATPVYDLDLEDVVFYACLSYDRVWKLLLFRKHEVDARLGREAEQAGESAFISNITSYITLLMGQWTGGFAYPDLSQLFFLTATQMAQQIRMYVSKHTELNPERLSDVIQEALNAVSTEVRRMMAPGASTPLSSDSAELPDDDPEESGNHVAAALAKHIKGFVESEPGDDLRRVQEAFSRATAINTLHSNAAVESRDEKRQERSAAARAKKHGAVRRQRD